MGSKQYFEERYGGRKPGKIDASLDAMLQSVEWGEYRIGDLFEKISTKKLKYKAKELPKRPIGEYNLPCLTSSFNNQGLNYYVPRHDSSILKNVITIPSNSDVYRAYYQSREFTVLSDAYAIRWIASKDILSYRQYLFMVMCINRVTDLPIYSYKNKLGGWNVVKKKFIQLPKKDGKIYFSLMDELIAELEAYLTAAGLKDYELTAEEEVALEKFPRIKCVEYKLGDLFEVKSNPQLDKSNFVFSENAAYPYFTRTAFNNGICGYVEYLDNEHKIKGGCLAIGMIAMKFFYMQADFYAGQFTKRAIPKGFLLNEKIANFFISIMNKYSCVYQNILVRDFENKFMESKVSIPVDEAGNIDYAFMQIFISAIQKLVIKDVVAYSDCKMAATKQAASK